MNTNTDTTNPSNPSERPWPVVLLTALGAWLAVLPLAGVVVLLLGEILMSGGGPYLVGGLLLAGAGVVLRTEGMGLFVEQVAVPMLLLGGIAFGFGLYRDLPAPRASLTLAAMALGMAWSLRTAWLQALLGACACALVLVSSETAHFLHWRVWLAAQGCVVLWAALAGTRRRNTDTPLEAISSGWILMALAGLAFGSGMTFLAGAVLDVSGGGTGWWSVWPGLSVMLAAASGAVLWHRLPALRQPWCAGAAAVALGLAWYMPALGAVWLVTALCVTTGRPRLAAAAGVAAVWILGAFYYQLAWSLADKASVLVGAGAVLGLLAWRGHRAGRRASAAPATVAAAAPGRARLGIALCAVAVLAVVNVAIGQKEDLLAHGRPVYVELAAVDPRSLMQGDYMALNYRLSDTLRAQLDGLDTLERPVAVAEVDARGVARLDRLQTPADASTPVGPTTLRVQLTPKNGRWVLVSDAWFFKEGDGQRWEAARYGEFRVMPDGRALLVGMADEHLKPIR
ncbi:GDYXXLXY domain-containing protein [Sphaerotilus sp.]|uniref:GDYXXLXY domain-containing protein n=1 Tax=Sphaerotilus sp. TaxID=2093942 RepID=UPI002ACE0EB5|nr:GDYXXLXY domain-containing protein [Sphaerotilus sp.]MDZ7858775.1 GDYXXLXY domain-containing protein [Sphaerotilus sp.]